MKGMVATLLIGWGTLVLGSFAAAAILVVAVEFYVKGGWLAVALWLACVSGIPALVIGLWLKTS